MDLFQNLRGLRYSPHTGVCHLSPVYCYWPWCVLWVLIKYNLLVSVLTWHNTSILAWLFPPDSLFPPVSCAETTKAFPFHSALTSTFSTWLRAMPAVVLSYPLCSCQHVKSSPPKSINSCLFTHKFWPLGQTTSKSNHMLLPSPLLVYAME